MAILEFILDFVNDINQSFMFSLGFNLLCCFYKDIFTYHIVFYVKLCPAVESKHSLYHTFECIFVTKRMLKFYFFKYIHLKMCKKEKLTVMPFQNYKYNIYTPLAVTYFIMSTLHERQVIIKNYENKILYGI